MHRLSSKSQSLPSQSSSLSSMAAPKQSSSTSSTSSTSLSKAFKHYYINANHHHDYIDYYFESFTIQVFIVILSLLSCVVYISSTYGFPANNSKLGIALELIFFLLFFIDFIINIVHSRVHRLRFLLSWKGICDFLSLIPILNIVPFIRVKLLYRTSWLDFLRFFRILHISFVLNKRGGIENISTFDNILAIEVSETILVVTRLILNITVFIFVSAGLVYGLSRYYKDSYRSQWVKRGYISWFDCLYITITIITTLNSDFSAVIWQSRLLNLFIILIGFSIVPVQIAMVCESLLFKQLYTGSYKKRNDTEHVIVCGILDYELLNRIITELFHPTHMSPEIQQNLVLVILSPSKPSMHVTQLLHIGRLKSRLRYYIGSPKSVFDLKRVSAESSFAIYMIGDTITNSLRFEEDSVFLNAISIQKYLQRNKTTKMLQTKHLSFSAYARPLTLVKLTGSGRSRSVLQSLGVNSILNNQELKYKLLAYSCMFPGLLAVFLNLNRARSITQKKIAQQDVQSDGKFKWQSSYYEGTRNSIHQISSHLFSPFLSQLDFTTATANVYINSNGTVLLVAAKINGSIVINPCKNITINKCEDLFVIGTSWEDCIQFISNRDRNQFSQSPPFSHNSVKPSIKIQEILSRSKSSATGIESCNIEESPRMTMRKLKFASPMMDKPSRISSSQRLDSFADDTMSGHIVVIITSHQHHQHTDIILPLICFIRTVRALSNDHILVFSDKAEELTLEIKEHIDDFPNLLTNLHWVSGYFRNPHHLELCHISSARVIVLMQAPLASEVNEDNDPTASLFLSADRHTIITSLNIHTILQNQQNTRDPSKLHPFVIAEIVHEANTNFLRNNDYSLFKNEDPFALQEFDWPLIAAGSVLSHTLMDSLMVQSIFHPNILNFWEVLLSPGFSNMSKLNEESTDLKPDIVKPQKYDGDDKNSPINVDSLNEMKNERSFKNVDEKNYENISTIDKVDVPAHLYGSSFNELFLYFLYDYNSIVFALYRWSDCSDTLPYVVCLPSPNTILKEDDEVFILKGCWL